jgi:hypothetical protein
MFWQVDQSLPYPKPSETTEFYQLITVITWKEKYHEKGLTFTDESENPPTTNDPSFEIDEQFNLWFHGIMIKTKYAHWNSL